jgi:non-specific serine/threonine protein kinase/NIMA (never in mitosis gene a)-related kinase
MRDKVRRKFLCVKIIKIKNIPKKEREATKVEVELLKRLNHPNIVRYIESFLSKNNESLCIAMEYCDGGDLASQIKAARKKLFSEDKILHWFVQIALGVHYMHTQNVLHRDLKTQNIFLLGNGRLVLGDLGISKVLEGTMDFAQTCIGTPYYMSPEIFKNKPYSYKSDVWALGCVLYEMTTLNHAFDANSLNGLAQKIIKGRYPAIHHKYSRYLRELIGHMLLPEPKQRPDLDQILRKPFIKKHILQFFAQINSRWALGHLI